MTDAQYIVDLAAKQYNETAEIIERHFDSVATQIRDWFPRQIQHFAPPPPPPPRSLPVRCVHTVHSWVVKHKAISAGLLAFVSTGAVLLYLNRSAYRQKRRAKRTATGARTEVVILAGSATSPTTCALAQDLERRGYIVYVVTNTQDDVQHIRNLSRADVVPFNMDLVYPENAHEQVRKLYDLLNRHHHQIEGDRGFRLSLAGVVLIPDSRYETGYSADITPEAWSQAWNTKVLTTILTTQQLWPLVTDFMSKVVLITPSIVPSLNPPGNVVHSTIGGALCGFSTSLAAELRQRGLKLTQIKLGHIEAGKSVAKRGEKGTPVRYLHEAVVDVLQAEHPSRTVFVGQGSLAYHLIGMYLPFNLVQWMTGLSRTKPAVATERQGLLADRVPEGSDDQGSSQWEKIEQME